MRLKKQLILLALLALLLAIPLALADSSRHDQLQIHEREKIDLQLKIKADQKLFEEKQKEQLEIQKQNDELKRQLEAKVARQQYLASLQFPVGAAPAPKVAEALAFYLDQGLSKTAAAYLVGNLVAESNLDHTNRTGDGGLAHGLAQWHPNRRYDMPADYQGQLAFVLVEMKRQTPQAYALITSNPSPAQAAQAMKIFEGYGVEGGRFNNAQIILGRI